MSSCISNKYKIVLYQAGLGSNHSHFNNTMKKISNFGGKHIVYKEEGKDIYNSYINMSLFNPIKG